MSHSLRVSKACFALGFRETFVDKIIFVGSFIVYATIMLLYGGVVRMIPPQDIAPFGFTHAQMIWYIGTTEFVLFTCISWVFKEVQADYLSGQAHLSLLRPYADSMVRIMRWAGGSLARILVMLPFYLFVMIWLTGEMAMNATAFVGFVLALPAAVFLLLVAAYVIGTSCLWFVQAEPAFWLWQKCIFLLGAMLWPMAFYPLWAQAIMWASPFPAILTLAGNMVLNETAAVYAFGFLHQAVWVVLFFLFLRWMDGVILRHIQKEGG